MGRVSHRKGELHRGREGLRRGEERRGEKGKKERDEGREGSDRAGEIAGDRMKAS
jgi:hypothetical protein